MKLLLDESLPRQLGSFFPDLFEVWTVQQMGWAGRENGDLLRLAAEHGFNALITADRGIEYQQNLESLPLPVIVMMAARTRVQELQFLVPQVVKVVTRNLQRRIYHVVRQGKAE